MEKIYTIYVFRCVEDKFYVGRTKDVFSRINEHLNTNYGSEWTRIYPIIDVVEVLENQDAFEEDKQVLLYMYKCGIQNVRGGIYSNIELTQGQENEIRRRINGATDRCLICSGPHFQKDCPEKVTKNFGCFRCGRMSHFANNCYARTNINGAYI